MLISYRNYKKIPRNNYVKMEIVAIFNDLCIVFADVGINSYQSKSYCNFSFMHFMVLFIALIYFNIFMT